MPEAVEYKYKCTICGKIFSDKDIFKAEKKALHCEQNHDIVYVPLQKSWVRALIGFIQTGEKGLISKELMDTLRSYR